MSVLISNGYINYTMYRKFYAEWTFFTKGILTVLVCMPKSALREYNLVTK